MARNLPQLEISVLGKGFEKVSELLKTLEDNVAAFENRAKRAGDVFGGSFDKASKSVVSSTAKIDKAVEASANKQEKEARDAAKVVEKAKRDEVKAVEKAEKEKQKIIAKSNKEVEKSNKQISKQVTRSLDEEQRSIKKANDERVREEKKTADKIHAARTGVRRDMLQGAARGVTNVVGAAARVGGAIVGLAGGFSAQDSVRYQMNNEATATRIANASKGDNGVRAIGAKEVMKLTSDTALSSGQKQDNLLSAFSTIQDITGDAGTANAKEALPELAKIATAQGVDVNVISKMFGNLSMGSAQQKGEDAPAYTKRIMGMVRDSVGSSLKAGISLTEIADKGGSLLGTAGNYGGDESANRRSLLSLAQHSFGENGNAAQSFTNARALGMGVGIHAKDLGAMGINVLDKNNKLKDVKSIAVDMVSKLGDDQTKWNATHLDTNAKEAANPLRKIAREAVERAEAEEAANAAKEKRKVHKFSEKEKEAIRRKELTDDKTGINKFVAQTDEKTVQDNFDTVRATNAQKAEEAMEQLRIQVGEKLVPALNELMPKIIALIPKIVELMDGMGKLATWIAENPWKSAFGILGASVGKEIALAFAAAKVSSVISSALSGGMSAGVAAAGMGGIIAAAVGVGMASFFATKLAIDVASENAKKTDKAQTGNALDNMNIGQKIKDGTATDAEKQKYLSNLAAMKEQQDKGFFGNAKDGITKPGEWISDTLVNWGGIDRDVANVVGGAASLTPIGLAASGASALGAGVFQTQADGNNTLVQQQIAEGDAILRAGTIKTADNSARTVELLQQLNDRMPQDRVTLGGGAEGGRGY